MQQTPTSSEFEQFQQNGVIPAQSSLAMPESSTSQPDGPVGIGGWLLLPVLNLSLTTLISLYSLITLQPAILFLYQNIYNLKPNKVTAAFFIIILSTIILILLASLSLFKLIKKSPKIRKIMSLYYSTVVVVTIASAWSDNALQTAMGQPQSFSAREIVISFVTAIIWIPYFHKSKRVANTFKSGEKDLSRKVEKIFS